MRNYYVEIPFRSNNYVFITYYVRWLLANEEDGMMIVITIGDNDHGDDDDDDDDDDDNNDDGDDHDDVIKMETFSALLAILAGNSPVTGELPAKANDTERWCFFYLRLNKRLSKQSRDWWFETPSHPLWRPCNVMLMLMMLMMMTTMMMTTTTMMIITFFYSTAESILQQN